MKNNQSSKAVQLWIFCFVPKFWHKKKHRKSLNQRTSGPVNAHLTPGPGIYFNAFIHVCSPRAGADNPLETNVGVNRKALSFQVLKKSLRTLILYIFFNVFSRIYNPGAGADNALGSKF